MASYKKTKVTLNRGGALRPQWRIGVGGGADPLNLVAQQDGVTSHPVFSRNLDMALAGDLDGDGQPELVVFDQPFRKAVALHWTQERLLGGRDDWVCGSGWLLRRQAPL